MMTTLGQQALARTMRRAVGPIGTYFTNPITYWVGMDLAPASPSELAEFRRHYADVHRREVVERNPGFVLSHQYELAEPDPRGNHGPRWLTIYELSGDDALEGYLARHEAPGAVKMAWTPGPPVWRDKRKTSWRMMWRRAEAIGTPSGAPELVRIVGLDPAPGADAAQIDRFDAFHTAVHVPEVMRSTPFDLGVRYLREPRFHPRPAETPRLCGLYEADAAKADELERIRSQRAARPAERTSGPPVWTGRTTRWRLTYRRTA